jgi:hypothetical protein
VPTINISDRALVADLYLWFAVLLTSPEDDRFSRRNGPLFFRWLPDGKLDALVVESRGKGLTIRHGS